MVEIYANSYDELLTFMTWSEPYYFLVMVRIQHRHHELLIMSRRPAMNLTSLLASAGAMSSHL